MPKAAKTTGEVAEPRARRARTDKSRTRRLVNLATDLVEERMRTGKATAAEIIHYLRLGSESSKLEEDLLRERTKMVKAKTKAIQTGEHIEALYADAKNAMTRYNYNHPEEDDDFDD